MEFSFLDLWLLQVLGIDLSVAIIMVIALRYFSGLVADVNTTEELSLRDNAAFGIALAGGILALALMLTGVMSGEPGATLLQEFILVVAYGAVGLVLIKLGRLVQDKLILADISIRQHIRDGNQAIAIVEVANTLATALILRAVLIWVDSNELNGLLAVLVAFLITQLLLGLVTFYRMKVYASRHNGDSLQNAFAAGNVALAMRYMGHLVGVSLAVTAASGVIEYSNESWYMGLAGWSLVALIFAVLVSVLSVLARLIVLLGINVVEEVDQQKNIAVGVIEAAIFVAIGLFFVALFA